MTTTTITWEEHDEHDIGCQSVCGRFEVLCDPIYGYFTLHLVGDSTSHCESTSMAEHTRTAEWLIESGRAPAQAEV